MPVEPIPGASHVKSKNDPTHKVFLTNENGVPVGVAEKSAPINCSSSGDNTIVAAVSNKKIKVTAFTIQSYGTVAAKFKDGASTDLTGPYTFQAREGIALAVPTNCKMFSTSAGNALVLNLSGAVQVVGHVTYFDTDET